MMSVAMARRYTIYIIIGDQFLCNCLRTSFHLQTAPKSAETLQHEKLQAETVQIETVQNERLIDFTEGMSSAMIYYVFIKHIFFVLCVVQGLNIVL